MGKVKDLTGQRFGRLTVIERCGKNKKNAVLWKCQCDCGNLVIVRSDCLIWGNTRSCGCLMIERAKETSMDNKNKRCAHNHYEEHGEITYLFDSKRENYSIVDTFAVPILKDYYWSKGENGYWHNQLRADKPHRFLHSFIYDNINKESLRSGYDIDHKDRNPDNNTIENLRLATRRENIANRIRNPITFNKKWNKYIAQLTYMGEHYYLGGYTNKQDAESLYKYAHKLLYGEYSPYFNESIDVSNIKMTKAAKEDLISIENISTARFCK